MKKVAAGKERGEYTRGARQRLLTGQLEDLVASGDYTGAAALKGELERLAAGAVLHPLPPASSSARQGAAPAVALGDTTATCADSAIEQALKRKLEECVGRADYTAAAKVQQSMKQTPVGKVDEETTRGARQRRLKEQLQELVAKKDYDGAAVIQSELEQLAKRAFQAAEPTAALGDGTTTGTSVLAVLYWP